MKTLLALVVAGCVLAFSPAHARKGNPEAGKAKSTPCAACHGANGVSAAPAFPVLAGQHRDYLEHVLHEYRTGKRRNPIMIEQAKGLSDADIADLAAYFSAQTGLGVKY